MFNCSSTAGFLRVKTQSVNTLLGNLVLCDLRFRVVVVEVSTVSTVVLLVVLLLHLVEGEGGPL